MRKILTCLCVAIILTNCEISVRKTQAQKSHYWMKLGESSDNFYMLKEFSDMKYIILSTSNGGTSVINLTKDALEVELLRRQLNK